MMANNKWFSMMLKDEKNLAAINVTSKGRVFTKTPSLNWAAGGGIYRGYTTCFYGPEGSGKSLLTMLAVGALHQSDSEALACLITSEFRPPEPRRLITLGVDPSRLLIRQANTIHDIFDWITSEDSVFENSDGTKGGPGLHYILKEGAPVACLVTDSIKGIKGPREQASESSEKDVMGDLSKYLNPALRDILPIIRRYDIMNLFVQQVNENMNQDEVKYQNLKYKIPSGQALKHFCESMALVERVTNKDSKLFSEEFRGIRELPIQEGHTIRVRFDKANLDKPFREAEFRLNYNEGVVDTGLETAMLAKGLGVIRHPLNKDGKDIVAQWIATINGQEKKWIGFDNMVNELEQNPDMQRDIMSQVYSVS